MKKLTKHALTERDEITGKLTDTYNALEEALLTFNNAMQTVWDTDVEPAIEAYNAAVEAAKEWRDEQVGEMEQYIDERSEKWEEGEAGQRYTAWKQEYEYLELERVELSMPEPVELESGNPAEAMDALDEAPPS